MTVFIPESTATYKVSEDVILDIPKCYFRHISSFDFDTIPVILPKDTLIKFPWKNIKPHTAIKIRIYKDHKKSIPCGQGLIDLTWGATCVDLILNAKVISKINFEEM